MKSLNSKVLLIILFVFFLYGTTEFIIERYIIYPEFLSLERAESLEDLERAVLALEREILYINTLCLDWAAWDDTHKFVKKPDDEYIESNLIDTTFIGNSINLIYICNNEGKVVWGKIYDLEKREQIYLNEIPDDKLEPDHPFFSFRYNGKKLSEVSVSGIFMTDRVPILIASRPIITSKLEKPINGSIIIGRFLTPDKIKKISGRIRVPLKIFPAVSSGSVPDKIQSVRQRLKKNRLEKLVVTTPEELVIYKSYPGISGNNGIIINVSVKREISRKGLKAVKFALLSLVSSTTLILILLFFLIQKNFSRPVSKITEHIETSRRNNDFSKRLAMTRHDEIGTLANEFDIMLEYIENQTRILERINTELKEDIEIRKLAENALIESEEKFRGLAERSYDLIFIIDIDGHITYLSPVVEKIFLYKPEEVLGKPFQDFILENDIAKLENQFQNIIEGSEVEQAEMEAIRKDGNIIHVGCSTSPIFQSGKLIGVQGILRDLTRRKKDEEELMKVKEQALQSEKMAALGGLVAGVAHEISTPIGAALMASTLLEDETEKFKKSDVMDNMTEPDIKKLLLKSNEISTIIHRNLSEASRLINTFKMVAVDQIHEDMRKFNLKEYLDGVLLSLKPSYSRQGHRINLKCPNDIIIFSYPGALSQIVSNLITNSLIHGFENLKNGEMDLEFSHDNETLIFLYKDNGNGMDPENVKQIFDPFFTTKRNMGGTGLGMHIVYNIVNQKLNGTINCSSEPGKGIQFNIEFPVSSKKPNGYNKFH